MIPFALAIFTGAFLLFQVQPLIGKYILPWFGGSPAVWTTCLLFFQVFLLGGYAYAHLVARLFAPRRQVVVHLVLLAAALFFLPIIPDAQWKPVSAGNPTWRILGLLTVTVGLPYLVLSATGPLMQQWFSLAQPGVSPYRLYALSNVGSLLALVSYPFAFEPILTRRTQMIVWSAALGLYAVLAVACAVRLWRSGPLVRHDDPKPDPGNEANAPTWHTRFLWLLFPGVATVLLMAITNKMCQDVAVIPFLWVVPLGLYLLSFILCFDSPQWYWRKFYGLGLCGSMALLCLALFEKKMPLLPQLAIYSLALFNCCMVCHGELYRLKPHPRHLTGFYLMIAGGGALGGVFVALVAPLIFDAFLELHWGLVLLATLVVYLHFREKSMLPVEKVRLPVWRLAAVGGIVLAMTLVTEARYSRAPIVERARNFYGILKVYDQNADDPWQHGLILISGEIVHGIQLHHPTRKLSPASYYTERSGLGLLLGTLPKQEGRRIGVLGLGAGGISAHGHKGDVIRFYEINPEMKRIAENRFSFLSGSTARTEVVLGDARLSLEKEAPQNYDVLILDAFSGDAVPAHLLTKEAFEIYLRHLNSNGVIAANISNRHLDLRPVMANLAKVFKLETAFIPHDLQDRPWWMLPSHWYLLSRNKDLLNHPDIQAATGEKPAKKKEVPLWTDDYASLLRVLK